MKNTSFDDMYGIILSAGAGTRVRGKIKALLTINNKTFIETLISKFRQAGIRNIILVLGYRAAEIKSFLTDAGLTVGLNILYNPDYESEQLVSLKLAVRSLPADCKGILFTPVDHPLTKLNTYKALLKSWHAEKENIYVPSNNYRKGHPTIFPRKIFQQLLSTDIDGGARAFLKKYAEKVRYIVVDDPHIIRDFDDLDSLEEYNSHANPEPAI